MTKKDTTVSEKKCAPLAILDNDTATPKPTAATAITRRLLSPIANAMKKNAPAASPDEKEQLLLHWSETTKAGVNRREPPNSCRSLGRARPK